MAEEIFRYIEVNGAEYRLEKFSPVAGLQLARLMASRLLPAAETLEKDGDMLSALCAAVSMLTDDEVEALVNRCLRFVCKKMKLGWAACVDAAGNYGVAELAHDPVTALALCAHALRWGLGDFFGESASCLREALCLSGNPHRL